MTFHDLHSTFTNDLVNLGFQSVTSLRIIHRGDQVEVEYQVTETFGPSAVVYFYAPVTSTPEELLIIWNTHLARHDPQVDRELRALAKATAQVVRLSANMESEAARAFGAAFAETLAANSTYLPAPKN